LCEDKVKQQKFKSEEDTLKIKKAGYGPNVLKAMVLEKTE